MFQKRMFKVVSPMPKEDGGTYWLRCGTAFVNKDNSINVHLDAIPCKIKSGEGVKLQLREYTEEDLRESAQRRATYAARGTVNGVNPYSPAQTGQAPDLHHHGSTAGARATDAVPF